MSDATIPDLEEFRVTAREWLERNAEPLRETKPAGDASSNARGTYPWGQGSDSVAVFHNLTEAEEGPLLKKCRDLGFDWSRCHRPHRGNRSGQELGGSAPC